MKQLITPFHNTTLIAAGAECYLLMKENDAEAFSRQGEITRLHAERRHFVKRYARE
jgi:hypothetical protein